MDQPGRLPRGRGGHQRRGEPVAQAGHHDHADQRPDPAHAVAPDRLEDQHRQRDEAQEVQADPDVTTEPQERVGHQEDHDLAYEPERVPGSLARQLGLDPIADAGGGEEDHRGVAADEEQGPAERILALDLVEPAGGGMVVDHDDARETPEDVELDPLSAARRWLGHG
ncbi:MAG: hypothetical protein AAGF11_31455 [Myxococcota bacterium]